MRKCADYHYFKHTLKQAYSKGWIQCPRCGKLCKANPIGVQLMTIPCLSLTFVMIEPIMPTKKNMINKGSYWYPFFIMLLALLSCIPTFLVDCIYMRFFMPFKTVPEEELKAYHYSGFQRNSQ